VAQGIWARPSERCGQLGHDARIVAAAQPVTRTERGILQRQLRRRRCEEAGDCDGVQLGIEADLYQPTSSGADDATSNP